MKKEKNSIPDPILVIWQNQMKQAAQTPWLASLLLKRARHLQQRLAYFYRQLTSLPRRWRRRIQRGLAAGLVGAALLLAWGPTPSVHAANITVTANSSGLADDNECSLVEAITNANNDSQVFNSVGECDAGSGPDTITLAGNTYTYTTAYGGASALPNINSEITIEANNSTIERDSGASNFRIIRVNIAGDLTLNEATISGGAPGGSGGGLANYRGTVTINSSTISGNSSGSGGGLYNRNGTVTINNSTISGNSAPGGNGGGIINYAYSNYGTETATLTINNSAISGNVSTRGGG
ncbi:MAG: hypothetical protein GY796_27240 [Chloroflexi bacterium]|nr:hypothetical protein [Chloroflexota bacterium]